MSELRQDIVTGQWVVIASGRALRPSDFERPPLVPSLKGEESGCPFCPGNESMTPLEVLAVRPQDSEPNTPGWRVRVFPNKYPAFGSENAFTTSAPEFPKRPAEGSHEVIVHTPDHAASLATMPLEDIEMVLRVYRHRYRANREDPLVRYIHIIVNHGPRSGASLEHSHSQLFGVPLVPPLVQQELAGASWHHTRTEGCVFCRMIEEELDVGLRVIARNKSFVALCPYASRFPYEAWILPREHQESYHQIDDGQLEEFAALLKDVLGMYRANFEDPPYNYFIHSAPCDGTSYPYYHWHLEASPRLNALGAFEMGTSMLINVVAPERACQHLSGSGGLVVV